MPSSGTDSDKAAELARVAGDESRAFLHYAGARARRLVTELTPLIGALIPVLVERRVITGDDIEQAIAAMAISATTERKHGDV